MHSILGSDWLWLPVLAVSAMIVLAAMVVTGAAAAAAFVVPYRRRAGRSKGRQAEVRQAPSLTSDSRGVAPEVQEAGMAPRSSREPAWGGAPLGTDVETLSA